MGQISSRCLTCAIALASLPWSASATTDWSIETVTTFGDYADIGVTPTGIPHIVFTDCSTWEICAPDPSSRTVWHGVRTGGGWSFHPIGTGPAGVYTDILVDASGTPHVVWVTEADDQVQYSVNEGAGWVTEQVYHEFLNRYRHTPVLTLDSAGEPHVVYNQSERMRYAYRNWGLWNEEEISGSFQDNWSARGVPQFSSEGMLLVGSWRYFESAILFGKTGGRWTDDPVGGDAGWNPWMEVDVLDQVHFTYFGHSGLSYATNASGSWVEELIDDSAANESNNFVLDGHGRPLVVYSRSTLVSIGPILYDVELILAYRGENGFWAKHIIDFAAAQANFSWRPRVAMDSMGTLHVLYRPGDSGELRYATRSAPTASPPAASSAGRIVSVAPNPFNPSTKIEVAVEQNVRVDLSIYDVRGRFVRRLYSGRPPGPTLIRVWDGSSQASQPAASGVYLLRLEAGEMVDTRRAVLLK